MVDFGKNDSIPHFIYCYGDYNYKKEFTKLKEILVEKMRKYGVQSAVLTLLAMRRQYLITKEKSKDVAEGKLKDDPLFKDTKGSINDDLDSFVKNLQISVEIDYEDVLSFFTPKLTKEELKLVEQKNIEHMSTYCFMYPDVEVEEMKQSDSKDKYVLSDCRRRTVFLSLELEQTLSEDISTHDISENSSDDSFEDLAEDVLSNVSSDVQSTTECAAGWTTGWAAGWAAGWDAGVVAGRMGDGMGRQSDDQPDNSSNHLRSSTRRRNSL